MVEPALDDGLDHLGHRLAHDRAELLPDLPLLVPENLTRERVDSNDLTEVPGLADSATGYREVVTSSSCPGFGHDLGFSSWTGIPHLSPPYVIRQNGRKKVLPLTGQDIILI